MRLAADTAPDTERMAGRAHAGVWRPSAGVAPLAAEPVRGRGLARVQQLRSSESDLAAADLDELVRAAACGDRGAAGEFLSRRLPFLAAMARKIAQSGVDADDLLSSAITSLLTLWFDRRGPARHVEAYLIRSMRNRVIDERRSPRSRSTEFDETWMAVDESAYDRVELAAEFALVRQALGRLPEDQQQVLLETVVGGSKPRELAATLGKSASSIHSLTWRAKSGLRRAMLQEILEQDAPPECRDQSAANAAAAIQADGDELPQHLKDCEHCSAGWRRYLTIGASFGVGSLLVTGCTADPRLSVAATRASTQERQRALRRVSAAGGLVGLVLVAGGAMSLTAPTMHRPVASMNVITTKSTGNRTTAVVDFHVDAAWTITALRWTVSSDTTLFQSPEGWTCTQSGAGRFDCTTATPSATGGDFVFASRSDDPGSYEFTLTASSNGIPVAAHASGEFPR